MNLHEYLEWKKSIKRSITKIQYITKQRNVSHPTYTRLLLFLMTSGWFVCGAGYTVLEMQVTVGISLIILYYYIKCLLKANKTMILKKSISTVLFLSNFSSVVTFHITVLPIYVLSLSCFVLISCLLAPNILWSTVQSWNFKIFVKTRWKESRCSKPHS